MRTEKKKINEEFRWSQWRESVDMSRMETVVVLLSSPSWAWNFNTANQSNSALLSSQ